MTQAITITQPSLKELAATLNREHALVLEAGASIIHHAILAGEALLAARAEVPRGDWCAWLDQEWQGESYAMATYYMRLARNKDTILDAPGIKAAIRRLAGQPRIHDLPTAAYAQEIRDMREDGVPVSAIASQVGISKTAVYWHLQPPERRRARKTYQAAHEKKKRAEHKAARKALERQERDATMKQHGGDAWDAYVLIRKLAPLLDQLKIPSAYARCAAIEDELVKLVKETT